MSIGFLRKRGAAWIVAATVLALVDILGGAALAQTPDGWERKMVGKDDVKLEIFERGSGRTVLMHPSLGRPAQDFEMLGNAVAKAGYHVVLINPRGIGGSTGPMDKATLNDLGNDVWMVADELDVDRAFVLGQNYGTRVSRAVSWLKPDRVIGLMLLACGGEVEPDAATWKVFWSMYDPDLSPEEHRKAVASSMFAPGNDPTPFLTGWHQKTAQLQKDAAMRTDFKPMMKGGTAPALVIQGLEDKIAPPQNAFDFATSRPNAWLVAFPDMGHAMLPEHPTQIADTVISFLNHTK
tara:strand:+ start:462 stop:1343 length:882 start_codon:yes stop_codon:yes gene_type:complete